MRAQWKLLFPLKVLCSTIVLGQFYSFGAHVKVPNTSGWGKREAFYIVMNETQGNLSTLKIPHNPGALWNLD